jgi:segregation and condensation protein A
MIDVKLEKFEGPLGLLVQLIDKEELDITQISLAQIADQYIGYIQENGNIDPDLSADFLVIAAKLLFIKSKTLLPYISPEEEEETEELEHQLKMFKEFLNASERINDIIKDGNSMFSPRYKKRDISRLTGDDDLFSPPKKLKADDLAQILREFIEKQGKKEKHKLEEREIEYKINIEEKIIEIQKKLVKRLSYSFKKLMNGAGSRTEVIVSFLAILELAKQKSVNLEQEDAFADIIVRRYGRDA